MSYLRYMPWKCPTRRHCPLRPELVLMLWSTWACCCRYQARGREDAPSLELSHLPLSGSNSTQAFSRGFESSTSGWTQVAMYHRASRAYRPCSRIPSCLPSLVLVGLPVLPHASIRCSLSLCLGLEVTLVPVLFGDRPCVTCSACVDQVAMMRAKRRYAF